MDFIKATGSGRDFRLVGEKINFFFYCPKNGWLEQTPEGVKPAMFSIPGFLKGEFEFVPDEVIEVGDEGVSERCDGSTVEFPCRIIAKEEEDIALLFTGEGICACDSSLQRFRVTRKGPKVEVYQNVRDMHFVIDGDEVFVKGPFKSMTLKETP